MTNSEQTARIETSVSLECRHIKPLSPLGKGPDVLILTPEEHARIGRPIAMAFRKVELNVAADSLSTEQLPPNLSRLPGFPREDAEQLHSSALPRFDREAKLMRQVEFATPELSPEPPHAPVAPSMNAGASLMAWLAKLVMPPAAADTWIEVWRGELAELSGGLGRWRYLLSQLRSLPQLVAAEHSPTSEAIGGDR